MFWGEGIPADGIGGHTGKETGFSRRRNRRAHYSGITGGEDRGGDREDRGSDGETRGGDGETRGSDENVAEMHGGGRR